MEVEISKAVLVFLPIVFSHAGRSASTLVLLGAGSFSLDPHIRKRFPQENWDQLISSSFRACELAITAKGDEPTIREYEPKIRESEPTIQESEPTIRESELMIKESEPTIQESEPTIRESSVRIGTSSRGRGLDTTKSWMNERPFKWILQGTFISSWEG